MPSYLTNASDLNLRGIITWGKLVKLSKSKLPPRVRTPDIMDLFLQSFHLALNFTVARLWCFILRKISFLVTSLEASEWYGPIIARIWWRCLIFRLRCRILPFWNGTRWGMPTPYNKLLHPTHHFCYLLFQESDLSGIFINGYLYLRGGGMPTPSFFCGTSSIFTQLL